MKKPPLKSSRPYRVNYLEGYYLDLARDIIKKISRKVVKAKIPSLSGRFSFKLRWEHVVIAFLLALVLGGARARIIPENFTAAKVPAQLKTYPEPHIEPVAPLDPIPVPEPVVAPQPVYTAPVSVTNCGSDPNMAFIYQHESGCRTDAINPIGACGIGQALPCSKMGCSLSDWVCQNNWFVGYAIRTYGSTYNAYIFWTNHQWW